MGGGGDSHGYKNSANKWAADQSGSGYFVCHVHVVVHVIIILIRITSGMTITSNMPNECGTIGIPGAETTACAKSFGTRNSDVLFQRKKAKEEFSSSFAFLGFSYGQANPAHTFLTNHHELIWGRFRSSR
jgi:hypothetical protein